MSSSFVGIEVTAKGFTWLEPTTTEPVLLSNACLAELPVKKNARVCLEVCDPSDQKNAKCVTVLNGNAGISTAKLRIMLNCKVGLRLAGDGVKGAVVHVVGNRMTVTMEESDDDGSVDEAELQIMNEKISKVLEQEMERRRIAKEMDVDATDKKKASNSDAAAKQKKKATDVATKSEKSSAKLKTLKGGVKMQDLLVGAGIPVKKGHNVAVTYTLRLENGKIVDRTKKTPFQFRLGVGECVKGFDIGVAGMRVGGERHLIIPSALGYGKKGAPPDIPPNSTLYFDIMVKKAW